LEGEVTSRVEDGIIKAEIKGDQTEVLVGSKGSMIRSVQELARTVVQRKTPRPRRVIIDIAGYGARRREALAIYAQRLAETILNEGGEIMLEPMNSADRKVVHDTIAEITDVRSYSEGEEPRRCVVVAVVEGYQPPAIVDADFEDEDEGDDEE
jgi:spoIIIJ-associated protein